MVILVSIAMVLMLIISVNMTLELKPEPTALHKPQNILLIPGVSMNLFHLLLQYGLPLS